MHVKLAPHYKNSCYIICFLIVLIAKFAIRKLLLSAKHSVLHPNSLPHCSLDDFMLVTSPLFVFCYPWR